MEEGLRKQENGPETLDYLSDEDAQRKSKYALLWYIGGAILAAGVLAFIIWCGVVIHRQKTTREIGDNKEVTQSKRMSSTNKTIPNEDEMEGTEMITVTFTSRTGENIESDGVLHNIIILGDAKGMHFGFGLQSYF